MHPQLIKLLALNKGKGFFKVENVNAEEATIYLYDYITSDDYYGGIGPITFAKEMAALTAPTINLRFNSPGGDVFAARAMEQSIREHSSKIIAHIDGYAASAASYLALASDEVRIADGAFFMIHKAWTYAAGNAGDLIKTANLLNKIDDSLVKTYAAETGQDADQIKQWMTDETWFNAEESVQYGFADSVSTGAEKSTASARVAWDLSAYAKAPANTAPSEEPKPEPVPGPKPEPEQEPIDLSNHYRQLAVIQSTAA